jgi:Na+/melibiose symporter-like transporter
MIANGTLPAHNVSSVESSNPPAPAALSVWFALFYFAYYFFSWTCTMIPYDALGMELTSDYSKRVSLFSVRVVFQFLGYAVPNAVGLVLSNIFPTNIIAVYAYTALVLGIVSLAALLVLGFGVSERPEAKTGQGNEVPPSVAVRGHRPFHLHHSSHWLRCPPWWLCGARCATGRTASTSSSSSPSPSSRCCPST